MGKANTIPLNKGEIGETYIKCMLAWNGSLNCLTQKFQPKEQLEKLHITSIIDSNGLHFYPNCPKGLEIGNKDWRTQVSRYRPLAAALRLKQSITKQASPRNQKLANDHLVKLGLNKSKSPAKHKHDLTLSYLDENGKETLIKPSIKSFVGNSPSTLNASTATLLRFKVERLPPDFIPKGHKEGAKGLVKRIIKSGARLVFDGFVNNQFKNNLEKIDKDLLEIIPKLVEKFYSSKKCTALSLFEGKIPLAYKKLCHAAVCNMSPKKDYNPTKTEDTPLIILFNDFEFGLVEYKDEELWNYLITENSYLCAPSGTRHKCHRIQEINKVPYINLGLQIRITEPKDRKKNKEFVKKNPKFKKNPNQYQEYPYETQLELPLYLEDKR